MSIYDSIWKEKAETFQRERDEARALLVKAGTNALAAAIDAEAAGYRKGVEDALDKVRKEKVSFKSEGYAGGIEGARGEIFACTCCEEEISALLEQTEPGEKE